MPKIVIGIGSNIDHKKNIKQAIYNLQQQFGELLVSPIYKSAPFNDDAASGEKFVADPSYYLNLVISFESSRTVEDVKYCLRAIEQQQMRERSTGLVSLDLDLLLYGDWVGDLGARKIPHDDIELCEFVLRPLADLMPNSIHPINGYNYQRLLEDFKPCQPLTPVFLD
jgi:2-amino-4-hydroxy-6-hydroxymethyldihydropteridine diphosphokinase